MCLKKIETIMESSATSWLMFSDDNLNATPVQKSLPSVRLVRSLLQVLIVLENNNSNFLLNKWNDTEQWLQVIYIRLQWRRLRGINYTFSYGYGLMLTAYGPAA